MLVAHKYIYQIKCMRSPSETTVPITQSQASVVSFPVNKREMVFHNLHPSKDYQFGPMIVARIAPTEVC